MHAQLMLIRRMMQFQNISQRRLCTYYMLTPMVMQSLISMLTSVLDYDQAGSAVLIYGTGGSSKEQVKKGSRLLVRARIVVG